MLVACMLFESELKLDSALIHRKTDPILIGIVRVDKECCRDYIVNWGYY